MGFAAPLSLKDKLTMHFHMRSEFQIRVKKGILRDDIYKAMYAAYLIGPFTKKELRTAMRRGWIAEHKMADADIKNGRTIRSIVYLKTYDPPQRGYKRIIQVVGNFFRRVSAWATRRLHLKPKRSSR